jgi:hypothetical protein
MSKRMALITAGFGLLTVGMSWWLKTIEPELSTVMLPTGLIAGGLITACGLGSMAVGLGRGWVVVATAALGLVALTQMVHAWSIPVAEAPGKTQAAVLLTVLTGATLGLVMYLLHGERDPEFYQDKPQRPLHP